MTILTTKTFTIKGVYENDTTFSRLLIKKIYEELAVYGFSCKLNETEDQLHISWNGKRRWYIGAIGNTSKISLRLAAEYGENGAWGSTYTLGSISSTSTSEQSISITIKFFAFDDFCYFNLNQSTTNYYLQSAPIISMNGEESALNWIGTFSTLTPLAETSMDNNWSISYTAYNIWPEDPAKCFISNAFVLSHSSVLTYIMKNIYSIATSAAVSSFSAGQVITVDGEKYINLLNKVFAKISADDLEIALNK